MEIITEWAKRFPSEPALIDALGETSWQGLDAAVSGYVERLRGMDVARVVLHLPQRSSSVALLLACGRARVDAVLVSQVYPESRAHEAREQANAQAVLTLDGDTIVSLGSQSPLVPGPRGEPMVGVLTSGSTGPPKCAMHTWRSLESAVKPSPRREGKRWLLCYPLSHIAALQVLTQCLTNRSTLVVPAGTSPEAIADATATHAVQCLSSTPTFLRQLLHGAPPGFWASQSLEQIILGGEIVDDSILGALREVAPKARVTHVYATTELGPVIVVGDGREGFDAALLDGDRLKVEDGELFVRRSASNMQGYLGHAGPAASDWWPTGDLVAVEDGRAKFRGRLHDVINVGGFKVSPAEVEAVLREIDGVRQVHVVAHKSSLAGNLVKAIVEAAPDVDRGRVRGDALALCRARLPSHMHPRVFEFVAQIAMTVTNKQARGGIGDGQ